MTDPAAKNLSTFLDWLEIPAKRQRSFLAQLGVFAGLMVLILIIEFSGFSADVEEGKESPKCPRTISFLDEKKTQELKRLEEEKIDPVITHFENAEGDMLAKLDRFFEEASQFYQAHQGQAEPPEGAIASYFLADRLLEPDGLRSLLSLTPQEFERMKRSARQILRNYSQEVITTRTLETTRGKVTQNTMALPGSLTFKQVTAEIVKNALSINAIEDEKQTRQLREAASRAVAPVMRSFSKGQKILEKGVIVTADDLYVLRTIESQIHKNRVLALAGNILLAALVLVISLAYLRLTRSQILKEPEQFRLIGGLWIAALLLGKVVYSFGDAYDQPSLALLLTPLPSVGILMAILLDFQVAMFNQLLLGVLMFLVAQANARYAIVSLLGGVIGILAWRSSAKESNMRSTVGWSGVKVGIGNSVALLGLLMLDAESFSFMRVREIAEVVACGFGNGILSGVLTNGALPYIESFFSLATSSRLLELADLSQPLIKRLAEEAPGTYQHSVIVGNLSEAAANEINADALLAKIGGYFHDIGKLKRPAYFAENQTAGNRHDQVTPYMSSLILVGHIRDGLDLGREYGLPERVLSLISQHHGTTLISYFYEQAKTDTEGEAVNEERFRYPGPKPQTKEAAIIMLADAVEAASRTLPQHTHSRIEGLVEKIIENKFSDENQLDESDLTLKDIERIQQTFVRVLTSMYHGRIDYPGKLSNQPKGASDGSAHQQPPKEDPA